MERGRKDLARLPPGLEGPPWRLPVGTSQMLGNNIPNVVHFELISHTASHKLNESTGKGRDSPICLTSGGSRRRLLPGLDTGKP